MLLKMSSHAAWRCAQMKVAEAELEDALSAPHLSYPNALGQPRGTTFVSGRIAVPVAEDGTILTILWHGRGGR